MAFEDFRQWWRKIADKARSWWRDRVAGNPRLPGEARLARRAQTAQTARPARPARPARSAPVVSVSLAVLKRRALGVLIGLILAYLAASTLYLMTFRLERDPGTVLISSSAELKADAERLAKAFSAEMGTRVEVVAPKEAATGDGAPSQGTGGTDGTGGAGGGPVSTDLAGLLASGGTDCALAAAGAPGLTTPAPGSPTLYLPDLLAVTFPSIHTDMTLEEARAVLADLAAGGTGPWPEAGFEVIGLADRTPDRQLLAVDGVYPTLGSVVSGAYPLSRQARLYVRRGPAGFFGLLGRVPFVRRYLQPNSDALREFAAWLGTDQARTALYGTGQELTLTAVGDIWFARNVGKKIDENGIDYPFALVADRLRAADITWCDLESPIGVTGNPLPGKLIWFRAKPETVNCLKPPGIDVVCLANNHVLDYDSPCLLETFDALEANGIAYCGAGRDETDARKPAIIEAGGLKVAFLAYTEYADPSLHWSFDYPRTFMAGDGIPGCNPLYLDKVAEDIAKAKEVADLVVVGYHWGRENEPYPTPYHPWNNLPEIARKTIDLGACLVLGTHPHHVQGYEVRGTGLIAYSLGNFVTDQIEDTQREGMILDVELGPNGVLSARITPVWSEGFRPMVMEGEKAEALLQEIVDISWVYRKKD